LIQTEKIKYGTKISDMANNDGFLYNKSQKNKQEVIWKETHNNKPNILAPFSYYEGVYADHYKYIQDQHNKNTKKDK